MKTIAIEKIETDITCTREVSNGLDEIDLKLTSYSRWLLYSKSYKLPTPMWNWNLWTWKPRQSRHTVNLLNIAFPSVDERRLHLMCEVYTVNPRTLSWTIPTDQPSEGGDLAIYLV